MTARLHLGCGDRRLPPPWINVDGRPGPAVDRVVDLHDLWGFAPESLDWVYTSHVIEHLYAERLPELLRRLHRALVPGGRLTIATIDIEKIVAEHLGVPERVWSLKAAIYGEVSAADHPMAAHRNCFTYEELGDLLVEVGFARVRPWDPEQYPEIRALDDFASSARSVTCYCEGIK